MELMDYLWGARLGKFERRRKEFTWSTGKSDSAFLKVCGSLDKDRSISEYRNNRATDGKVSYPLP